MELGEVYVKIGADIVPLEKALGKARTVTKNTTEQMRAQMKTLGTGMVIAGAAITAAFALTVKSAISFQKQLAQVSTMLDKSAMKILPQYKKGLLEMSVAFGESTDTLSKGLYDILSASIPPAEALDVLGVAALAATAGITDTGVAADAITTILNSYGMSADDAGKVSDVLFATVKRGKTTFAELAPAIGKSAAMASTAGLSFEDLGSMIATLTRAGIRTDEAMTSINGVLRAFLKPTNDARDAAAEFGLELSTTTLKTIGMAGVMDKLKDATAEQLAAIFPNIRGLKGMAAALGDVEGYAEDYALMLNSAGLTQEAFAKQSATLGFKIEQLKKSFNVIAVTIGDALIPVIQSIVVSIGKVTAAVSKWMEENPKLTATLVKLGAAFGVFTMAGGLLILGTLYFTNLKTAIVGVIGVSKLMIPTLGKLKIAIYGVGGALALVAANIIIWSEVWRAYQEVMGMTKTTIEDVEAAQANLAKVQEETAEKLGLTVEGFLELQKAGASVSEMLAKGAEKAADWDAYNKGLVELNKQAKDGKISASGLYKAMRDLAIETGVATDKTSELEAEVETIVTTVKDLTSEMELLTKEHEAYGKSVEDSIQYYTKMVEKLDAVEVILKTELMLLEQGTEEYGEKWKEILENAKAINTMKEALDELIEPLEGLDLIAAKMTLLGDSIEEIPAKLGLLQEKAVLLKKALDEAIPDTEAWWEAKTAFEANQEAISDLAGSFDEYGEKGEELLASLIELTDKQKELQEAIDVVGVDKQSEAYQRLKIEYNANEAAIVSLVTQINNLESEQREAEQAAKDLADAYKSITDKIYELTHTPMENAIRKLDQQKQAYLDLGVAIETVNKWYDAAIAKLGESNVALDEHKDKLVEATEATEQLGILGGKAWENFSIQIKHATTTLSNFTKEGVAAAIATIKMHFKPLLDTLVDDINNLTGVWRKMAEANLASLKKSMDEQIAVIKYGYKEYLEILESMGVEGGGGVGFPSYQHGTPYVPKTGLYKLHEGERVTPANQNTYNNSFSPTVNLSVQGGGSSKGIAQEVENVLYDIGRQFKRRGFEIIPGRG